jgi:hypothetical protein
MPKLNKTETRIMKRLEDGKSFSTDDAGIREQNAARSLVKKGFAKVTATHKGCVYSRHGNGRAAYSRPNYYSSITIRIAN